MMGRNKNIGYLLILSFLLMNVKCAGVKNSAMEEKTPTFFQEDYILFVTVNVKRQNDLLQVDILHQSLLEGKLKAANLDKSALREGDWRASTVNSKDEIVEWTKLENPLLYRAEYVNEDGELETKTIDRESGDVSFRLPIIGNVEYLKIERISNEKETLLMQINLSDL